MPSFNNHPNIVHFTCIKVLIQQQKRFFSDTKVMTNQGPRYLEFLTLPTELVLPV